MRAREWLLLVSLSILWGGSFFFAKVALGELGPLTVVFIRVARAALALNVAAALAGRRLWRRGMPCGAFMGAINNALPFSLIFWGQTHITSGLASILNATTPLFTVVVARFLTFDERLTGPDIAGGASRSRSPRQAAAGQLISSTILILPIMLLLDPNRVFPSTV